MKVTPQKIIKGLKLYTKNMLWPILHSYDLLFKKELTVAVADLMLLRDGEMYNRQFYATARLLDAKLYYEKGDDSLPFQVAVSYNYRPASYDREKRTREYIELMESVKKNGYDRNSHLAIDKDLYLINGTHRIALAIYNRITEIQVDCWRRRNIVEKGIEQWTSSAIDSDILQNVFLEFKALQDYFVENGQTFAMWISTDDITEAKSLFTSLQPYFVFHKFFKLSNCSIVFESNEIKNGYIALFTPIRLFYVIKDDIYYSKYVAKYIGILTKRITKLGYTTRFYISINCLLGQRLYNSIKKHLNQISIE